MKKTFLAPQNTEEAEKQLEEAMRQSLESAKQAPTAGENRARSEEEQMKEAIRLSLEEAQKQHEPEVKIHIESAQGPNVSNPEDDDAELKAAMRQSLASMQMQHKATQTPVAEMKQDQSKHINTRSMQKCLLPVFLPKTRPLGGATGFTGFSQPTVPQLEQLLYECMSDELKQYSASPQMSETQFAAFKNTIQTFLEHNTPQEVDAKQLFNDCIQSRFESIWYEYSYMGTEMSMTKEKLESTIASLFTLDKNSALEPFFNAISLCESADPDDDGYTTGSASSRERIRAGVKQQFTESLESFKRHVIQMEPLNRREFEDFLRPTCRQIKQHGESYRTGQPIHDLGSTVWAIMDQAWKVHTNQPVGPLPPVIKR
jgi:hypothetical protein